MDGGRRGGGRGGGARPQHKHSKTAPQYSRIMAATHPGFPPSVLKIFKFNPFPPHPENYLSEPAELPVPFLTQKGEGDSSNPILQEWKHDSGQKKEFFAAKLHIMEKGKKQLYTFPAKEGKRKRPLRSSRKKGRDKARQMFLLGGGGGGGEVKPGVLLLLPPILPNFPFPQKK